MFTSEVREFIAGCIRSVWALELLLFLRRNNQKTWTAEALTAELRSSSFIVGEVLTAFRQAGLVTEETPGQFRYAPAASHISRAVDQIASACATKPLAVSREILAAGNDKIRTFADAFRLKRDER